tara:strand:+ start:24454 stop:25050 length:597 start_codon:yes stop_codon:yes gene_type:complete
LLPTPQPTEQPLRKSAQRLRWFIEVFEDQARKTEIETGNSFSIDRTALTEVFTEWLNDFKAQKPAVEADKPAYVGFAAGLMLRSLTKKKPVKLLARPSRADETNPAYFWPEGYLYVVFCLNVRGLVLEKDFHYEQHTNAAFNEARTWWSFRENVDEDPSLAIAFLDLFAGDQPEWTLPQMFRTGHVLEIADRFYSRDR